MKRRLVLFAALIIGLALRLIFLRQWFHFEMDEATIAWKVRQFIVADKLFLIGGGTPFGFHLGPAFYYLSAIPLALSGLDPIGWAWAAAIIGGVTIVLAWRVGLVLYGRRVGLIFAWLWATSWVAVMADRHWWPLVANPLLSLITLMSLFKIGKGNKNWWIVLGLTLAFAWQADLSTLVLFIAGGLVVLWRLRIDWKQIGLMGVILALSLLPLVVFELRHPGANLGKLFTYQFKTSSVLTRHELVRMVLFVPRALSRLLLPVTDFDGDLLEFYSWCKSVADDRVAAQPWFLVLLAGVVLLMPFSWALAKANFSNSRRQIVRANRLVSLMLLSGIGGLFIFRLFGGDLFDFYLTPVYPIFLLSTAVILDWVWRRIRLIGLLCLISLIGVNLAVFARAYHPQGLAIKQEAVTWVNQQVGDQEFALESLSSCHRYNGLRYLSMLSGNEPTISFMDPNFFWLYDQPPVSSYPKTLVTFSTPKDLTLEQQSRYNQMKKSQVISKGFGDFEVMVIDNEEKELEIEF